MTNIPIDWAMVSALASVAQTLLLLISLLTLRHQLQRLRQESTSDLVAGLQTALKLMADSTELGKIMQSVSTGRNRPSDSDEWRQAFDVLNQIALLVDNRYTDRKLLMTLKAQSLAALARYVRTERTPELVDEGHRLYLLPRYTRAKLFLEAAVRWEENEVMLQTMQARPLLERGLWSLRRRFTRTD